MKNLKPAGETKTAEALIASGLTHQQNNELESAKKLYKQVLMLKANHAEAIYLLGTIAYQQQQNNKSIELIKKAIKINPKEIEYYVNLSSILLNQDDTDKAIPLLKKALLIDSNCIEACYNLGVAYKKLKQFDKAARLFTKLTELDPKNAEHFNNLGTTLTEQKKWKAAENNYLQAIKINPNYLLALVNLANVLMHQKKLDEAQAYCQQAIKINNQCSLAYNILGATFEKKNDFNAAKKAYQHAIDLDPNIEQPCYNLANLYYKSGQHQEAITICNKAVAHCDDPESVIFLLTDIYFKQGKYNEAINLLEECIQHKKNTDFLESLAYLYKMTQQDNQAKLLLENLIKIKPKNPDYYLLLGDMLQQQGDKETAITLFKKASKLDSSAAEYQLSEATGHKVSTLPQKYVTELFDSYSDHFEKILVDKLSYKAPKQLFNLLNQYRTSPEIFANAIDLGCGTGLCGNEFSSITQCLQGVDVAPKMIKKAREKKKYDKLYTDDITHFLTKTQEKFDLFISADVFIYVGDLDPVFDAIKNTALLKAYILFSVEVSKTGNFELQVTGRYAHSYQYIKKLAKKYGFNIIKRKAIRLRQESYSWIPGELYLLQT